MKSLWDDEDAATAVARYAADGVSEDLALRTYSARLLGAEPALVLHGGGNTSVKTRATDLFGDELEVLCVKGSGWDLATIEPAGHPAVRLTPLLRLRGLKRLSDEDMVNVQRANLLDQAAPNPSVETLLHAFIPERFIDHTHACAFLAIADQPDAERLIREVFGGRVGCVPYVMPGFELARRAADAYRPGLHGLALVKHGLFTFGDTARESYERMIALVGRAEAAIASRPRVVRAVASPVHSPARVLPVLRGALGSGWILDLRNGEGAAAVANDNRLAEWAGRGVATPDHVIRTKARPLVTPPPGGDLSAWRAHVALSVEAYARDYVAYFERNRGRASQKLVMLDPAPRIVAIPGCGLAALGRSAAEAAIVGDIAESWAQSLLDAEAVGRFEPIGEAETFDMEYWSLEQAKLARRTAKRLEGRVALITGAAGVIGAATAKALASEGCEVALLDLDGARAAAIAAGISRHALSIAGDVTRAEDVDHAFDQVCRRFGGLDIVVSNAGEAITGEMAQLSEADLRRSFDINFFSHQAVAKAASACFVAQNTGGALLFNVSKQALNPGAGFGAYGLAKSALLALVRQYALELGAWGVRVNALNPDRIRSGLLTPTMISARAEARGLSEEVYMAGNLLGVEVTAEDVAQAFVFSALMEKTTGAVIPVDGGNVAAMPR
ncbi:MAG TPA: bifunctional aldolase/short-chain dehydrogenase [Caulobacteraceae bacterium]|jgi:rhamnose utilization protein RhaD (predicted bifunctional aldolase and dehydrogenase)/NAD(P)-dependent dehydrogenase (short-subunit alcohol dehydrogenase family)